MSLFQNELLVLVPNTLKLHEQWNLVVMHFFHAILEQLFLSEKKK